MTNVFLVAEEFCRNMGWNLNHLGLHNVLYIAQVFSLGERGKKLFPDKIYAWSHGPVIPRIYHHFPPLDERIRICESDFPNSILPINREDRLFIKDISNDLIGSSDVKLMTIATMDGGAWEKNCVPGRRDSIISEDDMLLEYEMLWKSDD